ncbi:MAG: hypothetical protein Q4A41_05640, partial [Bacillota bacterium]|nr:hypothetical protein [Bacillota bacterium]
YMSKTEDMLTNIFNDIEFKEAEMPIYFNYGGVDMPIKERMAKQVSHKIDVHNSLVQIESNSDLLIEIGANQVLENLVKKINRKKEVMKIQTVEDFEKVRLALGK